MKEKIFLVLTWIVFLLCFMGMKNDVVAGEDLFYQTWISGNYDLYSGKWYAYDSRISYPDYLDVSDAKSVIVELSDTKYHVLIRELDNNKKVVKSVDLAAASEYQLQEKTQYLGITVYCPTNGRLTYEDYHNAFLSGLQISVSPVVPSKVEETVEQKEPEKKDTFYQTWISGNYDLYNGKWSAYYGRISYPDYLDVSDAKSVIVELSDTKYHVLIRELDNNKKVVKSVDLAAASEYQLQEKTQYLGVTVYCPENGGLSYEDYHNAFLSGLQISVSPVLPSKVEETVEQKEPEKKDTFYQTWISGNYDLYSGKWNSYYGRISYPKYLDVNDAKSVIVELSDTNYHVLIRELDNNKKVVKSVDLAAASEYQLQEKTQYLGVTVYCPKNGGLSYEDYHNAFLSGLQISVKPVVPSKVEETTEQKQPEKIDTFYQTWISGNYDQRNGKWYAYSSRICYADYLDVTNEKSLIVTISDSNYHVLLRELSDTNTVIKSSELAGSTEYKLSLGTKKVAVTVYCPANSKLTYEDYHNAFLKGLSITVIPGSGNTDADGSIKKPSEKDKITNSESDAGGLSFVDKMGPGWNLGNSLICCNGNAYSVSTASKYTPQYYETLWGNPVTTKQMITTVKNAGFRTVRVPVTYRNHVDKNYQIDPVWMARVKEVVDYVVSQDMYCVINIHHEDWLVADALKQNVASQELAIIWKQIATYFGDYNDHLIFEGFNEVINSKGQWDTADAESYRVVNAYNQVFVHTVRATGGNNRNRYLIVNTYAAKATSSVLSGFVLPTDSIQEHLIVGVHVYDGSSNIPGIMSRLHTTFVSKGIPVFIGEWGVEKTSANTTSVRVKYAKNFVTEARKYRIGCAWWDDGCGTETNASKVYNYSLLCRKNATWYFPEIVQTIMENYR